MSFAARTPRLAMVTALAAAGLFSLGGLTGPRSAQAADSQWANASTTQQDQVAQSQRAKIVRIAESHVGANYRFGAEGMKSFDCSGLVYRVYKEAGLLAKISGARRGARAYYHWFKRQGLASKTDPKPGDLVIWHKGKHIGIYVGNGKIVSALNEKYGVRKHGIKFVSGFTAYLHVQLGGQAPAADSAPGAMTTTVKVTVNNLMVRDGPGKTHRRIAIVHRGMTINVTGQSRDARGRKWLEGKLPSGKVGWVAAWYVRAS